MWKTYGNKVLAAVYQHLEESDPPGKAPGTVCTGCRSLLDSAECVLSPWEELNGQTAWDLLIGDQNSRNIILFIGPEASRNLDNLWLIV